MLKKRIASTLLTILLLKRSHFGTCIFCILGSYVLVSRAYSQICMAHSGERPVSLSLQPDHSTNMLERMERQRGKMAVIIYRIIPLLDC